ncbi:Kinase, CMGC CDK [Giardia muris]|uniref:Kinase, CMGC CDK n=1 Tax=Giardia muris TaxID=5742 RepID=A0A4Z1ST07_GIAMU|nr:Kinase, CMGC CDK [Giardia muris]|eukprot:TNJ29072.1 Kinase, CMGC CDK [Giardia muris]
MSSMSYPRVHLDESAATKYSRMVEENRLGSGSYGDVYRCQHLSTGEVYAIKRLRERSDATFGLSSDKYLEIVVFGELKHENIVRCQDIFFDRGRLCFALEFCPHSLGDIIDSGHYLSLADRKTICTQLLRGLAYLHANHISHFDLKPENVLVRVENGRSLFKITDFGLSLITGRFQGPSILFTGKDFRWSPPYRPPEVFGGVTEVGPTSDLWSIGLVFLELIVRKTVIQADEAHIPNKIADLIGAKPDRTDPNIKSWAGRYPLSEDYEPPGISYFKQCVNDYHISPEEEEFIGLFLQYDPAKRISAEDALSHPFLKDAVLTENVLERDRFERNLRPLARTIFSHEDITLDSQDL